ncbi:hypothetical protein PINS_up007691 [Pythium insidiosum]|nr:hypothetical protein PINS_up007691 [Pythium insidiosum]
MPRPLSRARLMSFSVTSFLSPSTATPVAASGGLDCSRSLSPSLSPLRRDAVRVSLRSAFSRRTHPDAAVEAAIEDVWQTYKQRSPRLFNGTKFRLHCWTLGADGLAMDWGLTDYRTYLGTCASELVTRLRDDGVALCGGDATAFLSRKVGVSAVLETADQRLALIERSRDVGVYQHLFDTPGGHPEPSDLGLTPDLVRELERVERESERRRAELAARDRLFDSILDEVHEEVNLPRDAISDPLLLGVVLQSVAETPSFAFYMTTPHTAEQVMAMYREGPADQFESSQLRLIDAQDAERAVQRNALPMTAMQWR